MNKYALTFVSVDKPGIVAKVSGVLYDRGFNIEDSSSTTLSGIFSMILLVQHEKSYTPEEVKAFFKPAGFKPAVYEINDVKNIAEKEEHYVISVYGADKPGIVHNITRDLYEMNINILDLQTQITGTANKEVYIMILEVTPPEGLDYNIWSAKIKDSAKKMNTDIAVRHIETYEL